ncbi:MAG: DUF4126 domain-containing protein [Chloroflexota bacterium]
MHVITLLQTTAYIPNLTSRPFLSTFIVALLAQANPVDPSQSLWGFQAAPATPAWFIHPITLSTFAVLALLEVFVPKFANSDMKALWLEIDGFIKAGITLIVTFALVDPESAVLLGLVAGSVEPLTATTVAWSGVTSVGSFGISRMRNGFYRWFQGIDEEDDIGLRGVLSWLEDLGTAFGVILATFLPVIAIILFGVTLLGLWLLQKYIDFREANNRTPCPSCQQLLHPAAPTCHYCGEANPSPCQIGFFGQTKEDIVLDRTNHILKLLGQRRCPTCAVRLPQKAISQTCPTCQTVTFASTQAFDRYLNQLRPNLIRTLLICLVVGIVPILGLIVGIIYYRLSLIASLRRYVPRHTGCMVQWGVRLLNIVLVALQPIPILGWVTLPLMCYTNYTIYQNVLQQESKRVFE